MKKLDSFTMSSLLALEIKSISFGYLLLAEIANLYPAEAVNDFRILEASAVGSGFLILLIGQKAKLEAAEERVRQLVEQDARTGLIDSRLFNDLPKSVLNAFYSLESKPLEECLLVVEASTVSGLLSFAVEVLKNPGVSVIELRVLRTSTGGAYGFFTGSTQHCAAAAKAAENAIEPVERELHFEVIAARAPSFREFFSPTGRH